jgi:hypothetical protein
MPDPSRFAAKRKDVFGGNVRRLGASPWRVAIDDSLFHAGNTDLSGSSQRQKV